MSMPSNLRADPAPSLSTATSAIDPVGAPPNAHVTFTRPPAATEREPITPSEAEPSSPSSSSASVNFIRPQFGASPDVVAATSRMAGRINAADISKAEISALLREHQGLVDKVLDGTITRREQNRLSYVRWSLDRIEDAKLGAGLDVLEKNIEQYERILRDVRTLQDQLSEALHGAPNKGRKRAKR
jgi:hypothetical protein